jgi:hypothetical protein
MLRRVAVTSCIGTTVEWYDFFIYATVSALVFNNLFFPSFDPLIGSLVALGTYAAGFIARPIGGLVFGVIGGRKGAQGRRRVPAACASADSRLRHHSTEQKRRSTCLKHGVGLAQTTWSRCTQSARRAPLAW